MQTLVRLRRTFRAFKQRLSTVQMERIDFWRRVDQKCKYAPEILLEFIIAPFYKQRDIVALHSFAIKKLTKSEPKANIPRL